MSLTVKLLNGKLMPIIGLGTWQSSPEEVTRAVEAAIDAGYRHIDTAYVYANEEAIAVALKTKIATGVVKREDLFITTKLHSQFHGRSGVKDGIARSLKRLGLDYVDLYLIHAPISMKLREDTLFPVEDGKLATLDVDHLDTWKGMEDAYNQGFAKAIGLSNFNSKQIKRIYDNAAVKPMNLQVECHAYFPQVELQKFCADLGITFCAYAPLGSPNRTRVTLPGQEARILSGPLDDEKVKAIAAKHGKTAAQILLRYLIQRNIVVIPKSITPARIKQNFDVFDVTLNDAEMKQMANLGVNERTFDMEMAKTHSAYPFGIPW